jgi:hypothetical protein
VARPGQVGGKRDYAAEYRARIARITAQGYSRSQARGHAKSQTKTRDDGSKYTVRLERSIRTERIRDRVQADRTRAFGGEVPERRRRGESAAQYRDRLGEPSQPSQYDWPSFEGFMDDLQDDLTEHEIYELWFGY